MERILEIIGGFRPAGRERLRIETPVPMPYAAVDPDRLRVELAPGAAAHLVVLHTRDGISALDVTLAEGAQLEYTELFLGGAFSETFIEQGARSRCRLTTALLSGANASYCLDLTGPDAENDLGGVFLLGGSEHGVVKLLTRHLSADCRSDSTVKGVAGGHAVGEFSGLVYVAQDAQRTDARQQSRNVLLSPEILQCFLLLYARKIDELPFELECSDLNALSAQFDRHTDIFYHLLLLLDQQPAFVEQFSRLIAAPESLFTDFHLSIAHGFALLRSVCDSEAFLLRSSPLPAFCDVSTASFAAVLKRFYPANLWDSLDFGGFVSFWMLRYADLEQPTACYAAYRSQLDASIEKKEKERSAARSDRSIGKQIARLKQQRELLQSDEKQIAAHIQTVEVCFISRGN